MSDNSCRSLQFMGFLGVLIVNLNDKLEGDGN